MPRQPNSSSAADALPLERPLDRGRRRPWSRPQSTDRSGSVAPSEWREDDQYTSRQPPYRPGNFWFTSTSELLAIDGYTPEIYASLRPHVSALPPPPATGERWKLNVNTATDLVLASLLPNLGPLDVEPFLNGAYEEEADFPGDFRAASRSPQTPWTSRAAGFC